MASNQFSIGAGNGLKRLKTLGFLLPLLWFWSLADGQAEQNAYHSNLVLTVTTHILTSATGSADGDSIPDIWEMRQFGTTYIANNGTDFDKDGYLDYTEYMEGTDPKNPRDPLPPEPTDTDSMDDNWEIEHFGSVEVADDDTDWDSDGFLDKDEYFAGTDPKQSNTALFQIHNFRIGLNGQMLIDWPTSAETNPCARGYVLVMGSNLAQLIHQPIALFTNIGNGTESRATNTMTLPAAFYGIKAYPIKDNHP